MNTRQKGDISEGVILATLIQKGFIVSMPFGGGQRYDMIVEREHGKLLKAQCKTGRLRCGAIRFSSCSVNGFTGKSSDYRGEVDVFLVYCPDNGCVYWVPVDLVGKKEGKLRISQTKNGQGKLIRWARDFLIAG